MKDVFCRIIDKEIPSTVIYEDDDVIAILDISQVTKGHTLVMPKEHYDNFLSCPKDIMHKVMDVAQRIGQAQREMLGAVGTNILANCGEIAGQSVPHFHVHVIPRYTNSENTFAITMKENDISGIDMPLLASTIKEGL